MPDPPINTITPPRFPDRPERSLANFRTGDAYRLAPLDDQLPIDAVQLDRIVAICNQTPVYSVLFADRLLGTPYALTDAERFVAWARRGWREGTHFVFLILGPVTENDDTGDIAGALDIKSRDTDSAEIGYWLDEANSGVMTNAVLELQGLARDAGYAALHALVRVTNSRSANLLTRAGFARTESFEKNGRSYERFERRLR